MHITRRKGLDDNVSGFDEFLENLTTIGALDVKGYAPLTCIVGPPVEALFRVRNIFVEWADVSSKISTGRLDLDNVGPQVSQDFPTIKTLFIGQVQDTKGIQHRIFILLGDQSLTSK
jgi:hypothetical protein